MAGCRGNKSAEKHEPQAGDPCASPKVACCGDASEAKGNPLFGRFDNMISNCMQYAERMKSDGRPVVGIMCEYTPRELILAAGGVPVCLCGGSSKTIASAEEHLPANLCPLIKSTYGYLVERSNPFLEMADLVVAETTCDGKKKMYELMAERVPMHVLELPQKPSEPEALDLWMRELVRLKQTLERVSGNAISDEKLRNAIRTMNRERSLRRGLAELMKGGNPPLSGLELLKLKSSISGIECDLAGYEKILAELSNRTDRTDQSDRTDRMDQLGSLDQSNNKGSKASARTKPIRVLLTGVPLVSGQERVAQIIEQSGGLIVCMENCTGLKPILEDVAEDAADPLRAIAEKYLHLPCSVMSPNDGRLDSLAVLAEEYRVDCVIELVWQACLTYDVESWRVRRLCSERLHLPYLRIETDYSPSDTARISLRVQALFETVENNTSHKNRSVE